MKNDSETGLSIRKAEEKDIPGILRLLSQVLEIHAEIRPDIFVSGTTKYGREELCSIINGEKTPVFVAVNENSDVIGYAFCIIREQPSNENLVQFKYLYIDDLCVDGKYRGMSIGKQLFEYVKNFAKELGCYEITLNVWRGNNPAENFYEKNGFKPQKTYMEYILE